MSKMLRAWVSLLALLGTALLGGVTASAAPNHAQPPDRSATNNEQCRPEGLYSTPGVDEPYCLVYDTNGREKMGPDHPRRIIGYFAGYRNGSDGTPAYLVPDIPWDKVTHINYAFATVSDSYQVSVGDAATQMTWPNKPAAEMDPDLPYQGHFNLLAQYSKKYPDVKILLSIGGWAASTNFYPMTVQGGSVNQQGIDTFANSVVEFLRTYEFFDGVDIDYEYPTTMPKAGHPDDWDVAAPRKDTLMQGYAALMKTLRDKLNHASAADGEYYMLTAAVSASGYLLRGQENMAVMQYLDYVNLMTYDLHGAWNQFVGPTAPLFDDGQDAELAHWNVYTSQQYGGIGYLNTDWAYHYARGTMPAGRINIGVPYYTRGWRGVTGGEHGLWGDAIEPNQAQCPDGTRAGELPCGDGAVGIDNIWHDTNDAGEEIPSGANPMWHALNLQEGITPNYLDEYGLTPETDPTDRLTGDYVRYYDDTLEAAWLWNDTKDVFLSMPSKRAMKAKANYVIDNGIGGIMIWELSADYDWYPNRNGGKGAYFMGDTLTTTIYNAFKNASPYEINQENRQIPNKVVDIDVDLVDFPLGTSTYPISPTVRITNNTGTTIPGGTEFSFAIPTSVPASSTSLRYPAEGVRIDPGHTGPNVGGLTGDFHRVSFSVPEYQSIPADGTFEFTMTYNLPMTGPSNWTVTLNGTTYGLAFEHRAGTTLVTPGGNGGGNDGGNGDGNDGGDTTPPGDNPPDGACTAPTWQPDTAYTGGDVVTYQGHAWKAKWWTKSEPHSTQWGPWKNLGPCP